MTTHRSTTSALVAIALLMVTGPAAAQSGPPPSKTLERGLALHEQKIHQRASSELFKVVSGQTRDSPASIQRAQYTLVKSLLYLQMPSAAMSILRDIQTAGLQHRHFAEARRWVMDVTTGATMPELAWALEPGIAIVPADDDLAVVDRARYVVGTGLAALGRHDDALRALELVEPTSESYANARFMAGMIRMRIWERQRYAPAVPDALDESTMAKLRIDALHDLQKAFEHKRLGTRALLLAGRLQGLAPEQVTEDDIDGARAIYQRLPVDGASVAFKVRLERSLLALRAQLRTTGASYPATLAAVPPTFLSGLVYHDYCSQGPTVDVLQRLRSEMPVLRDDIRRILDSTGDTTNFQFTLGAMRAGKARLADVSQRLIRAEMARPLPALMLEFYDSQLKQRERYARQLSDWREGPVGVDVLQRLDQAYVLALQETASITRERLAIINAALDALARHDAPLATVETEGAGLWVTRTNCPRGKSTRQGAVGGGCAGCAAAGRTTPIAPLTWSLLGLLGLAVLRRRTRAIQSH